MIRYAYIAGPVTGIPDRNRPAFEAARPVVAEILGLNRRFVCIPHDLFWPNWTGTEARAMEVCLSHICCFVSDGHAMTVVALPGWRESAGSLVEVALARKLGVPVVELVGAELREVEG